MSKRSRSDYSMAQRRAMFASTRERTAWPYSKYGRTMHLRGTPSGIERYGSTWKQANAEQRAVRAASGYTGRGLYAGKGKFHWKKAATTAQRFAKKHHLGQQALAAARSYAGNGLYDGVGLYAGRGMYEPSGATAANVLIAGGRPPMTFGSGSAGESQTLVLSHTEYLRDVFAPATAQFANTQSAVNPGISVAFRWLSQIAVNFEEYEFTKLVFKFHATINETTVSSTGQSGSIIMCFNYDPDAPKFLTKDAMMQYHGAISQKVTQSTHIGVECDDDLNAGSQMKFVRAGPLGVKQDLKDYDMGTLQLALSNVPSEFFNQQLGELWVEYEVKLTKPRMFAAVGRASEESRYYPQGSVYTDPSTNNQNYITLPNADTPVTLYVPQSLAHPHGTMEKVASSAMLRALHNNLNVLVCCEAVNNCRAPLVAATGTQNQDICLVFPSTVSGEFLIRMAVTPSPKVSSAWNTVDGQGCHDIAYAGYFILDDWDLGGNVSLIESSLTNGVTDTQSGVSRALWAGEQDNSMFAKYNALQVPDPRTIETPNYAKDNFTASFRVNVRAATEGLDNFISINMHTGNTCWGVGEIIVTRANPNFHTSEAIPRPILTDAAGNVQDASSGVFQLIT